MAKVPDNMPLISNPIQSENKPAESKKIESNFNKILCCSCFGGRKEKRKTNIRDLLTLIYWKKKLKQTNGYIPHFTKIIQILHSQLLPIYYLMRCLLWFKF